MLTLTPLPSNHPARCSNERPVGARGQTAHFFFWAVTAVTLAAGLTAAHATADTVAEVAEAGLRARVTQAVHALRTDTPGQAFYLRTTRWTAAAVDREMHALADAPDYIAEAALDRAVGWKSLGSDRITEVNCERIRVWTDRDVRHFLLRSRDGGLHRLEVWSSPRPGVLVHSLHFPPGVRPDAVAPDAERAGLGPLAFGLGMHETVNDFKPENPLEPPRELRDRTVTDRIDDGRTQRTRGESTEPTGEVHEYVWLTRYDPDADRLTTVYIAGEKYPSAYAGSWNPIDRRVRYDFQNNFGAIEVFFEVTDHGHGRSEGRFVQINPDGPVELSHAVSHRISGGPADK